MTALATHAWAYPFLEVVHILGIALLIGPLALLDLRVFGRGAALPLDGLVRLAVPVALSGFALAGVSGLVMFSTQAVDLLGHRAFTLKMLLVMLAGANAAWFHARGSLQRLDGVAKLQAGASMLVWIAVMACGRWIAYL